MIALFALSAAAQRCEPLVKVTVQSTFDLELILPDNTTAMLALGLGTDNYGFEIQEDATPAAQSFCVYDSDGGARWALVDKANQTHFCGLQGDSNPFTEEVTVRKWGAKSSCTVTNTSATDFTVIML
ncbi:hypothetical protein EDD86DRAFT_199810 [Gorgonomyces haynaldii]|nr:hypothetical protein EDD86DRAFT_199810 [Gorgonomyces haynaldii]